MTEMAASTTSPRKSKERTGELQPVVEQCRVVIRSIQERFRTLQKKKKSLEIQGDPHETKKDAAQEFEVLPPLIADNNRAEEVNQATLQLTHAVQITTGEALGVDLLEKSPLPMKTDSDPVSLSQEMEITEEDNPETIATIERTISAVEKAFRQHVSDEERTFHTRSGFCSELSGFATLLARAQGLDAEMYQIMDINLARGVLRGNSLNHYDVFVRDGSQLYLIDLSFGQFFKTEPDQHNAAGDYLGEPVMEGTHPVVQQLITKGYVKATPAVLREYFNLTVPTAERTAEFDPQILSHVAPEKPVHVMRSYAAVVEEIIPENKREEVLNWVYAE
jgi:hypothetical protein